MNKIILSGGHLLFMLNIFSCKALYGIKSQKNITEEGINKFYEQIPVKDFKKVIVDSTYSSFIRNYLILLIHPNHGSDLFSFFIFSSNSSILKT